MTTKPIPLKDMAWKDAEPLYRAAHEGKPLEYFDRVMLAWVPRSAPNQGLYHTTAYRLARTRDTFDFAGLDSKWRWAARDGSGRVYVYTLKPSRRKEDYWICAQGGACANITGLFPSYVVGTCPASESLIERPE